MIHSLISDFNWKVEAEVEKSGLTESPVLTLPITLSYVPAVAPVVSMVIL